MDAVLPDPWKDPADLGHSDRGQDRPRRVFTEVRPKRRLHPCFSGPSAAFDKAWGRRRSRGHGRPGMPGVAFPPLDRAVNVLSDGSGAVASSDPARLGGAPGVRRRGHPLVHRPPGRDARDVARCSVPSARDGLVLRDLLDPSVGPSAILGRHHGKVLPPALPLEALHHDPRRVLPVPRPSRTASPGSRWPLDGNSFASARSGR